MLMVLFIRLFNLTIAMQHEVYVFGEDGMPHILHISVYDVTSSTVSAQGSVTKCTILLAIMVPVHSQVIISSITCRVWMLVNNNSHLTRTLQPDTNSDVYILFHAKQPPVHH